MNTCDTDNEAVPAMPNAAMVERQPELLERFEALSPRVAGSSVDLIREDRESR